MNTLVLTDYEKWLRFKKGDDKALSCIYYGYSQKLCHYGLKFTKDSTIVEDTLQELFAELIKNRRNLSNTDNIFFYLLTSYKRKLIRNLQKKKRNESIEYNPDYDLNITYSIEHEIINEEISSQKSALLFKYLKDLSPRQKEAMYLRFTNELDYKEASEIMNISVEASRNLISDAIKRLKESFKSKAVGHRIHLSPPKLFY